MKPARLAYSRLRTKQLDLVSNVMARPLWTPRPRKAKPLWRKANAPRYFRHYWDNETWEANGNAQRTLNAIYGNQFFRRSVAIGDIVYVVTVRNGILFLGGRLEVGTRTRHDQPILADWAQEIRAKPNTATAFNATREVPRELAERLIILSSRGPVTLEFDEYGLNHQKMRTMRELSTGSAAELDRLID